MYTEEVFNYKKIDTALRNLKSTLFDVVDIEEEGLQKMKSELAKFQDEKLISQLESLIDEKSEVLSDLMKISRDFKNILEKSDAYSRSFFELITKYLSNADTGEFEKDGSMGAVYMQNGNVVGEQYASDNFIAQPDEDNVQEYQGEVMSVEQSDGNDNSDVVPIVQIVGDTTSEDESTLAITPEGREAPQELVVPTEQVDGNDNSDVVPIVQNVGDTTSEDESTVEITPEGGEAPQELVFPTEQADGNDNSDVVPIVQNAGDTTSEDESTLAITPEGGEAPQELVLPTEQADGNDNSDVVPIVQNAGDATPEDESTLAITPEGGEAPQELVLPTEQAGEAEISVQNQKEGVESDNATVPNNIPAIGDSSATQVVGAATSIPEVVPIYSPDEMVSAENDTKFYKNDQTDPKAILTTKDQVNRLRGSRDSQEALIIATGFFAKPKTDVSMTGNISEQQLVENGLLPPSVEDIQSEIEKMMQKANDLYKKGEVNAAQELYSQVSELNKKLQTDSVTVK